MRRALGLEFRKMRRLRTLPIALLLVAVLVALASGQLMAGGGTKTGASMLMSYTMVAAMISPIMAAVVASRQTEIEHSSGGWWWSPVGGIPVAQLCRAKLLATSLVMLGVVAVQTLLIVLIALAAGVSAGWNVGAWASYVLLLLLVNVAFLAVHTYLAARFDNQLLAVGVGILGGFAGIYSLLAPSALARVIPWGYYALISHTQFVQENGQFDVRYLTPEYPWIIGFVAVVLGLFTYLSKTLETVER
ncbi:ABC transporter permease [Deinococcus radiopugnans]|uniref:ABC transporter permease n=1 Tax=Deinococcus radiopugnans ATCC 19172 TaxID=585398 RepID=A0A5C4Y8R1_9DEIO|nr:ABC transporter permease [Deinococcus radiopugnans]MBB6015974.1 hypothetical protein [Deinococcus radiopugnans ATCC 19172]TNM72337.1 ABC transporter permease [Deinococcus radiopugnans ATCC 19172]